MNVIVIVPETTPESIIQPLLTTSTDTSIPFNNTEYDSALPSSSTVSTFPAQPHWDSNEAEASSGSNVGYAQSTLELPYNAVSSNPAQPATRVSNEPGSGHTQIDMPQPIFPSQPEAVLSGHENSASAGSSIVYLTQPTVTDQKVQTTENTNENRFSLGTTIEYAAAPAAPTYDVSSMQPKQPYPTTTQQTTTSTESTNGDISAGSIKNHQEWVNHFVKNTNSSTLVDSLMLASCSKVLQRLHTKSLGST